MASGSSIDRPVDGPPPVFGSLVDVAKDKQHLFTCIRYVSRNDDSYYLELKRYDDSKTRLSTKMWVPVNQIFLIIRLEALYSSMFNHSAWHWQPQQRNCVLLLLYIIWKIVWRKEFSKRRSANAVPAISFILFFGKDFFCQCAQWRILEASVWCRFCKPFFSCSGPVFNTGLANGHIGVRFAHWNARNGRSCSNFDWFSTYGK